MRAVLLAKGAEVRVSETRRRLNLMRPLLDRPVLQHVIEILANQGVTHVTVVLCHQPEPVEQLLGDGTRWGVELHYTLSSWDAGPYQSLLLPGVDPNQPILLAEASCAVSLQAGEAQQLSSASGITVFAAADGSWTGWAVLPAHLLQAQASQPDAESLSASILHLGLSQGQVVTKQRVYRVTDYSSLMKANLQLLKTPDDNLMSSGRQVAPGIRLCHNVRIHEGAQVTGPVFVGANSRIGQGVVLGPNAVIGWDCIISEGTTLSDVVVLPGTYVGPGLTLKGTVADGESLLDTERETVVELPDAKFLAAWRRGKRKSSSPQAILWLIALFLLAMGALPLIAWCLWRWMRRSPVFEYHRAAAFPFRPSTARTIYVRRMSGKIAGPWSDFCHRVLPALPGVLVGSYSLAGLPLRSVQDLEALEPQWRALYGNYSSGLITEALVARWRGVATSSAFDADLRYVGRWKRSNYDLKLVSQYIRLLFRRTMWDDSEQQNKRVFASTSK